MWSSRRIVGETVAALATAAVAGVGASGSGMAGVVLGATSAAGLCVLRRALPASALVAACGLAGVWGGFWLLMPLVGWSAGGRVPAARRVIAAFVVAYALHAAPAVEPWRGTPDPQTLLLLTVGFATTTVLPGLVSRYRAQRRTLLVALHEHNEQLLREREMIAAHWRLRERQRIAEDMHDSLGHRLALITVQTGALEVDSGLSGDQRDRVRMLREAAAEAMRELREAVGVLHEDGVGVPAQSSGPAARGSAGIGALVADARQAGAAVELHRTGETRALEPAADHTAYRIVQEALTNALKHAPGAAVTVELRYEPDALVAEVADGGPPAPVPVGGCAAVSGGQGLTGLRERARLVGGLLHAGPTEGGGFRVAGILPYGSAPHHVTPEGEAGDGGGRALQGAAGPPRVPDGGAEAEHGWPAAGTGTGPVDWHAPQRRQRELATAMGRSWRGVALGCGTAAVCAGVLLGFGVWALREWDSSLVSPSDYAAIEVGADEAAVRDGLPDGSLLVTDVAGAEPPRPAGTECLVRASTEQPDDADLVALYRFCFADGVLVAKDAYTTEW
ncbi:sensor histidine kinase [Streptomyces lonarensis]|uniref:histidine kinase n=2 Tax=Streptomyces lonarensis TaxID=700599 RepID=A0A7X6CZM1_9ACTN|nr:sensor histidine kinase [Streptomyces lonarensis]